MSRRSALMGRATSPWAALWQVVMKEDFKMQLMVSLSLRHLQVTEQPYSKSICMGLTPTSSIALHLLNNLREAERTDC